jgi:hypothetical protein
LKTKKCTSSDPQFLCERMYKKLKDAGVKAIGLDLNLVIRTFLTSIIKILQLTRLGKRLLYVEKLGFYIWFLYSWRSF